MGLLTRMAVPEARAVGDDFWYRPVGAFGATSSGVNVTPDSAMTMSAVYACVKVLAEGVGSLPLIVYRNRGERGKARAREHPLFELLHDAPNERQTSFEWREMSQGHLALRGNSFSEIKEGPRGFVDQLLPLHPDRVQMELMPDGSVRYRYRPEIGTERTILADQMFHIPGLSSNGYTGISVIALARESVGVALAAESYGGRVFSQDGRAGGAIRYPGNLSKNAKKRIADSWQDTHAGLTNAHKVAVLDEGMEWQEIGMTSEDAQYLQTREFEVNEIARWFRIPPHMIGDLRRATFSNIEMQSLEFVIYTLMPWLNRWEQRITKDLIIAPQTFFAEFLVDGFLRGNAKDRAEVYAKGRQWGWFSVNDIRARENLNPVEGGDVYLQPSNMVAAATGQRAQMLALAHDVASRVSRRELTAMARLGRRHADDGDAWRDAVAEFYELHGAYISETLTIDPERAAQYADARRELALERGVGAVDQFEGDGVEALVAIMLGEEVPDAVS